MQRDDEIGLKTLSFLKTHRVRVETAADADGKDGWLGTPEGDEAQRVRRIRWDAICAEKEALKALVLSLRMGGFAKLLGDAGETLLMRAELLAWRELDAAKEHNEAMLKASQIAIKNRERWNNTDKRPRAEMEDAAEAAHKASTAAFFRLENARKSLQNAKAAWSRAEIVTDLEPGKS